MVSDITNKNIILSILIPTYNRPQLLNKLLLSLSSQLNSRIEIVVRDDSNNDETSEIVNNFSKQNICSTRYYKGPKIGVDAASLFLLEKARGLFVWAIGDDEIIQPDAVLTVINLIHADPQLNFIWVNFAYSELSYIAVNRPDGYFQDGNEVIESLGTNIGLISSNILRTNVALQGLPYASKHVHGFSFAWAAIVFWVLTESGRFYFLRGPYVVCNPTTIEEIKSKVIQDNGDINNLGFLTYGVYFYEAIKGLDRKFKSRSVRKIISVNFASVWRGVLVGWVGGWDTPKNKRLKMLQIYWSYPECWVAIILFCMPRIVVKNLYNLYKLFFFQRKFIFHGRLKKYLLSK